MVRQVRWGIDPDDHVMAADAGCTLVRTLAQRVEIGACWRRPPVESHLIVIDALYVAEVEAHAVADAVSNSEAHLEPHHESAGGALAPVEQARPLEPRVDVVQVQVLPRGLAAADQLPQLRHLRPHARPCREGSKNGFVQLHPSLETHSDINSHHWCLSPHVCRSMSVCFESKRAVPTPSFLAFSFSTLLAFLSSAFSCGAQTVP